jgi:multiple sugar transport system permease protein
VILPVLRPVIGTVLLLTEVAAWNDFFLPLAALGDPDLLSVTVGLHNGQALSQVDAAGEQV